MNNQETMKLKGGVFKLTLRDKDGNVLEEREAHNKMTNASLAVLTGLIGNTGAQTAFGYLALGTDNTAAAASQTALVSEIVTNGLSRAATTNSRTTTAQTNDTLVFTKTFTVSGASTIQEIGIFNDSSTGTMLCRAVVSSLTTVSGTSLQCTYTLQMVGN